MAAIPLPYPATEDRVDIISDPERCAIIMNPLRLRLLKELATPNSAAGLARVVELPRQKINYHLREMEKHGYLELVEERRSGTVTERIVRATATSYLVSPDALGQLGGDPASVKDRFSLGYLVSLGARMIRDLARLRKAADKKQQKVPTFSLTTDVHFASATDRAAFSDELTNCVAKLVKKYHNEEARGGRSMTVVFGAYPTITRDLDADAGE